MRNGPSFNRAILVALSAGCLLLSVVYSALRANDAHPPGSPFTRPAAVPTTNPGGNLPSTHPSVAPIPPDVLQQIYRRELGAKYNPADATKLLQTQMLIERYFDATTGRDRAIIERQIGAVGLDPNIVGRLCRVRMYWPAIEEGVYYVNEKLGPHDARYFLGIPKGYDRTRPWPLVIKLPTANAFLSNPPPDGDQVAAIYVAWMKEELEHHPDAIVLMPLLNLTELYGPSYAGMNSVIQPLQHVCGRVNVDPARVYMVGHSMSAHAAWNLALHYTTYFAAFNPLAGGASADWQRLRVMNLRNVLPVVWADASDKVINPNFSRNIVKVLRKLKIDVEYEETKNLGHAPDAATADRAYDKMRARTRDLYPAEVMIQSNRPDPLFNRIDWLQLWQPVNAGKERKVYLNRGTGVMMLNDNSFTATADRKGNRFDVKTENVDSFRILVNDQMVDFTKPISVVVNKRGKFEAIVKPNIRDLLTDQLFLGRGWRYFTAVIDIDVIDHPAPLTRPSTRPTTRKGTITVGPGAASE